MYVEPYPKSVADRLHADEIIEDSQETVKGKITFGPFLGVAPRQYLNLFSKVERKAGSKAAEEWELNRSHSLPRYPPLNAHLSYVPREKEAILPLAEAMRTN